MKIHVVLVRPEYASNVGAAARAMANMAIDRLVIIQPQCRLGVKAREMAAGAQEKLREATIYRSWQEFFAHEGEGIRLGLSRRTGKKRKVFPLEKTLTEIAAKKKPEHLYLIFGPERDGLDTDDLAYVNYTVHLPVFGEFGSFNLAQAVLLASYLTRQTFKPKRLATPTKGESAAPVQPLYVPDALLKEWLTTMGFDVNARRASAFLTLRRLFLQNLPTRHEIQVLEAILQQNIRKLKGVKSLGLTAENLADDSGDIVIEKV